MFACPFDLLKRKVSGMEKVSGKNKQCLHIFERIICKHLDSTFHVWLLSLHHVFFSFFSINRWICQTHFARLGQWLLTFLSVNRRKIPQIVNMRTGFIQRFCCVLGFYLVTVIYYTLIADVFTSAIHVFIKCL